ncbi:MAG: DUF2971 domain-containing protein [Bacteroidales bacterium]|nr:DUF2971 domain-containing protein [Bacteroidales bacterium]
MDNTLSYQDIKGILYKSLDRLLDTDVVYKYSNYTDGINLILLKQSLKFSSPKEFNDPFDCHNSLLRFDFDHVLVDNELKNKFTNRGDRRKAKRLLSKKENYEQLIDREKKRFKMSCFSESYKNVLMWSHYADKHKGICIGFKFSPVYRDRFVLAVVKYIEKIIPLDGSSDVPSTILYWLTTKSKFWGYEAEIRAITKAKELNSVEYVKYEKEDVVEIIFGCKISNNEIDLALKAIKDGGFKMPSIRIYKMIIDEDTFSLKKVEYSKQ